MVIYLNEFMQPIRERELEPLTEASFSFLPKFKRDPELKKYVSDIEKAKRFLELDLNEMTPTTVQDIFRIIFRFFEIWEGINSVFTLPLCLTIIGIPFHLFYRVLAWGGRYGYEEMVKSKARVMISKFKALIDKETDPDKKAKLEEKMNELQSRINKQFK